jgi:enoyl-CoA hydratase
MSDIVTYSQAGDIATLTMDDRKANALAPAMSAGLSSGLDRAAKEAKAVVIRGRAGVLCGGYDLKIIRGDDDALKAKMRDMGTELMLRLYQSPQPIIFACTGHSVAAGGILLMAADLRIGLQGDFKIGLNETAIGLALPYVGLELARDRLAPTELQQATIMAKLYGPVGAVAAGYLDQAVPAEAFDAAVQSAAEGLVALDAAAFAETKRRLRQHVVDRILALS